MVSYTDRIVQLQRIATVFSRLELDGKKLLPGTLSEMVYILENNIYKFTSNDSERYRILVGRKLRKIELLVSKRNTAIQDAKNTLFLLIDVATPSSNLDAAIPARLWTLESSKREIYRFRIFNKLKYVLRDKTDQQINALAELLEKEAYETSETDTNYLQQLIDKVEGEIEKSKTIVPQSFFGSSRSPSPESEGLFTSELDNQSIHPSW